MVAHQDDWQLFMGTDAFNDINAYNEKNPEQNGHKVVIIYTTSGNLHDNNDTGSCECQDPFNSYQPHFPYWKVREVGAKNSVHLAANRMDGWGPSGHFPDNQVVTINGHTISTYSYKNTTSYFTRIKGGEYNMWRTNLEATVGTMDNSTTYADWADFVNTLYYIFKAEIDSSMAGTNVVLHFQDPDVTINLNDHFDHTTAGRAACEAAKLLGADMNTCIPELLYVDYNTQNLPPNLSTDDAQNEAALTSTYCMALLDYNAWPEWAPLYRAWDSRNYYRTLTTCAEPLQGSLLATDSLATLNVTVFPTPANQSVSLRFNLPISTQLLLQAINISGTTVYQSNTFLDNDNTLTVNTSQLPNGSYMMRVGTKGTNITTAYFEIMH